MTSKNGIITIVIIAVLLVSVIGSIGIYSMQQDKPTLKNDDKSKVMEIVDEAITLYDKIGDESFGVLTAGSANLQGDMYPFALSLDGKIIAHGAHENLVGTNSILSEDKADIPFDVILKTLENNGSVWVMYTFDNPATNTDQTKKSLLVLHDGYIFGSGYYLEE